MNLKKVLSTDVVKIGLSGSTKEEIIEEMVNILVDAGKTNARDQVLECIFEREAKMSTGMQAGIAIPHGKTDAVNELIACIGIKGDGGVDFESLDGQPSQIFIMTVSPIGRTGPHVQFLAEISQLLQDEGRRKRVLNAYSKEALLKEFLA
jgi:mannitol/fructose-specific phosphotransferase system IIA component (Ntr-type)